MNQQEFDQKVDEISAKFEEWGRLKEKTPLSNIMDMCNVLMVMAIAFNLDTKRLIPVGDKICEKILERQKRRNEMN